MIEELYFNSDEQVKISAASVGISKRRWICISSKESVSGQHKIRMQKERIDVLPIVEENGLIKEFFLNHLAVLALYFISFSTFEGLNSIQEVAIFSFNLQMIIVYFYVLKYPENLGNGHIYLAGIINDVVIGTPLGASSVSYLVLSLFSTYIRNATLRSRMTSEWTAFIPALFFSNLTYFIIINNFSNLLFYYVELLRNTFFTFLFFPIFYFLFNFIQKQFSNK